MLVRVETDFTFGESGEAKGLRFRVGSGSGVTVGWRDDTAYPLVGPRPSALPFRAAVLPLADDASRVVTVEVWLCSTPSCDPEAGRTGPDVLVEQRAIFSFVQGEQRELVMLLSDACRGQHCENPTETCRGRVPGCQSARVNSAQLPGVGATPSTARDGSTDLGDATEDGAPRDGDLRLPDVESAEVLSCEMTGCAAGSRCCKGACRPIEGDARNCGGCDVSCVANQICDAARCRCPDGSAFCDGRCIPVRSDPLNCGGCGRACGAGQTCTDMVCRCPEARGVIACGACVDSNNDPANCGVCARRCEDGAACVGGACVTVCPTGEMPCGGRCVRLSADAANCGSCGHDCGVGAECASGACRPMSAGASPSCSPPAPVGCGSVSVAGATVALGDAMDASAAPVQSMIAVSSFAMDRYEVTVGRFRRFWDAGHSNVGGRAVRYPSGMLALDDSVSPPGVRYWTPSCNFSDVPTLRDDHPMNCLTWGTAQAFCVWDGGRLPTEAEWELAARGADGRVTPWGGATGTPPACVSYFIRRDGTCAENDAPYADGATRTGIWNLIGNVAELTADRFVPYSTAECWMGRAQSDPLCRASTSLLSLRGGSWADIDALPSAHRAGALSLPAPQVGFRCVRAP